MKKKVLAFLLCAALAEASVIPTAGADFVGGSEVTAEEMFRSEEIVSYGSEDGVFTVTPSMETADPGDGLFELWSDPEDKEDTILEEGEELEPGSPEGSEVEPGNPEGSEVEPGNPEGSEGSEMEPGNPEGSEVEPGNPEGSEGSEVEPGNPEGSEGSEMEPGNPEGSEVEPGNPEGSEGEEMEPENPEESEGTEPENPEQGPSEVFTEQNFQYLVEEETAVLVSCTGTEPVITVPEILGNYPVKAIGEKAFAGGSYEEIHIPEGVQRIGAEAFLGCGSLRKVFLPASVAEIGENAFSGCVNVVLYCPGESYAWAYALENGISCEEFPVKTTPLSDCTISIKNKRVVYNGKQRGPGITISDGEKILVRGQDYTITFVSNIDPGTASAIITGIGHYEGTVKKQFKIVPAVPKLKSVVSKGYNSVKVTWAAVKGAETYRLYYKKAGAAKWSLAASGIKKTSYVHQSAKLKTGTKYFYTVKAEANGVASDYNKKGIGGKPVLGTVKLRSAVPVSYNQIKISWNALAGATSYKVYQKQGSKWIKIGETASTSYTHTGTQKYPVNTGVTYTYTVVARRRMGTVIRNGSYDAKGVKAKTKPEKPILISAVNSGSNFENVVIRWNKAAGADTYFVYRKIPGKKWERIAAVKGGDTVSYTHTDSSKYPIKAGTTYLYTVRAQAAAGKTKGEYDPKGVSVTIAKSSGVTDEMLRKKAKEIIARITSSGDSQYQKLRKCWYYIMGCGFHPWEFPDQTKKDWKYKCAWDVLTTRAGNCYGYANGFSALARELGYTPYVIELPHVHCFVLINGGYWDNMGNKMGVSYRPLSYTPNQISKF